jgi:hypothetical protein
VARLRIATADQIEETLLDNRIGKIEHAQTSIVERRALAIGIPALWKAVDIHPPPILPTAEKL